MRMTRIFAALFVSLGLATLGCEGDIDTAEPVVPTVETGEADVDLDPTTDADVDIDTPIEGDS